MAAAEGVMAHLREREVGIDTHVVRVPIVPAAVMFNLPIGRPRRTRSPPWVKERPSKRQRTLRRGSWEPRWGQRWVSSPG